jgi:hypothetical protein
MRLATQFFAHPNSLPYSCFLPYYERDKKKMGQKPVIPLAFSAKETDDSRF